MPVLYDLLNNQKDTEKKEEDFKIKDDFNESLDTFSFVPEKKYVNDFELVQENDKDLTIEEDLDNFSFTEEDKEKKFSDISETRKFNYGRKSQLTTLGNAWQYLKALNSQEKHETFTAALQRVEKTRQKEKFKQYPEFEQFRDVAEGDGYVITGRMADLVADPVYLAIPWARVAQANRLMSVGLSAAVGAADMTLHDKVLYGHVNLQNTAYAALFAGAGGAIGDVIAQAIKPTRGRINSLGSDTGEDVVRSSGVGEQQLLDFGEEVFEENASVVQRITKNDNEIINLSAEKTILKKLKAELLESKQLDLELGPTIGPPKPNQKTSRSLEIDKITKEIKSIDKKIKNIIIKQQPKERANLGMASFLKGIENGTFTDQNWGRTKGLAKALVQETIRPAAYGLSGGITGLYMADDSVRTQDNDSFMNGIIAGIAAGFLHKRILNYSGGRLSPTLKDKILTVVGKEAKGEFSYSYRAGMGRLLATTHSAFLSAGNEVVQGFGLKMLRNQGTRLRADQVVPESVEEMTDVAFANFSRNLMKIFKDADKETVLATGRLLQNRKLPSTSKYNFLQKGDLENEQALEAFQKYIVLENKFKQYIDEAGLTFKNEDAYGLTQLFKDSGKKKKEYRLKLTEAFKIQYQNNKIKIARENPNLNLENDKVLNQWASNEAKNYLNGSSSVLRHELISEQSLLKESNPSAFLDKQGRVISGTKDLSKSSRFLDNERVLYDQEARAFANELFIQDPIQTTLQLYQSIIPSAEFARVYGSRGEGITKLRTELKQSYIDKIPKNKDGTKDSLADHPVLQKAYQADLKNIADTINNHFGVLGIDNQIMNVSAKNALFALQTMVATTGLTKVVIPSLGDIMQTLQNSGYKASANSLLKQIAKGSKPFADKPSSILNVVEQSEKSKILTPLKEMMGWKNKQYGKEGTMDSVLKDTVQVMDEGNTIQEKLKLFQRAYFEAIQLGRITRFARSYAYDAGAFRVFNISKKLVNKGKISKSELRELSYLGSNLENAKRIGSFKNMDEAWKSSYGKKYIEKAGQRSADRDALIPQLGNRRLFSQSRNPLVKFTGTFLSWAQAKGAQTSSLLSRVEDGDVALGIRVVAGFPVYAAIRQLALAASSSPDYADPEKIKISYDEETETYDLFDVYNARSLAKVFSDSWLYTGQSQPFYTEKIVQSYKPDAFFKGVENFIPAINKSSDLLKTLALLNLSTFKANESLGVAVAEETVPFAKDVIRSKPNSIFYNYFLKPVGMDYGNELVNFSWKEAAKNRDKRRERRDQNSKGGRINLAKGGDPEDRNNMYAGESFFETTRPSLRAILEKRREERENDNEDMPRMPFNRAGLVVVTALKNYLKTKTDDVNPKLIGSDLTPEFLGVNESFITAKKQSAKDVFEKTSKNLKLQRKEKHVSTQKKYKEYEQGKITYKDYHSSVMNDVDDAGQKLYAPAMYNSAPLLNDPLDIFTFIPKSKKDKSKKTKIIGVNEVIKNNEIVALRLHIPAYQQYNKYIVTVHGGTNITQGVVRGYSNTGYIKKVNFNSSRTGTKKVHDRIGDKNTFGRMEGEWQNHSPEELATMANNFIKDTEWVQVGYNPDKFSYFYNKLTGNPLKSADEVIQVGALVLAKNVEEIPINDIVNKTGVYEKNIDWLKRNLFDKKNNLLFNKGGLVNRLKQRNMHG